MRYHPQTQFVAPAQETCELWRTILGFIIATSLYLMLTALFLGFLVSLGGDIVLDQFIYSETPLGVLMNLLGIALMIPAVFVVTKLLHRRGALTLIGPLPAAAYYFWRVLFALVLLNMLFFLLPGPELDAGLAFSRWIVLLPLSLLFLLLQVSAEEVVFRGYLQQQLGARFSNPLIWMILPSAFFGWLHYAPEEFGANAVGIVLAIFLFGLAAADLTARTGNIGAAVALHFANNFFVILIASPTGYLSDLALYTYPFSFADEDVIRAMLPVDIMLTFVSWLAARLALRV